MQPVNWRKIIEKYSGIASAMVPEDIRKDVVALVQYAKECHQENERLAGELRGAKDTVLALVIQAGGQLDVPFSLVAQIGPDDILEAEDVFVVDTQNKTESVKRFRQGNRAILKAVPKVPPLH